MLGERERGGKSIGRERERVCADGVEMQKNSTTRACVFVGFDGERGPSPLWPSADADADDANEPTTAMRRESRKKTEQKNVDKKRHENEITLL